jgi:hypothetical protein
VARGKNVAESNALPDLNQGRTEVPSRSSQWLILPFPSQNQEKPAGFREKVRSSFIGWDDLFFM